MIEKELLANSFPRRLSKQAPRVLASVLSKMEETVVNTSATTYNRVFARWILVQCWGTVRFDDDRGMKPFDISFTGPA